MRAEINGAELCIDATGDPGHPAVLLIMGAGGSMDRWEDPFCARLAAAGRYVIRYDHRDTGGSTTYPPDEPGYTGDDLIADAVGIPSTTCTSRARTSSACRWAARSRSGSRSSTRGACSP
jgi:pimeloyl-ACP methyl ester carboxylesterase